MESNNLMPRHHRGQNWTNRFLICSFLAGVMACHVEAQQSQNFQSPQVNDVSQVGYPSAGQIQTAEASVGSSQSSYLETRVANLEAQIQSMQMNASNYSGNSNCNNCGERGFYFGAAAVWAKPHFKESFEYSQTSLATGQQTLTPFEYDYNATPRIWLGFRNAGGVGLRATYWNFDAAGATRTNTADGLNLFGAHAVTIIFPANIFAAIPGSSMETQSRLETQITNLYATYDVTYSGVNVSGGVGLRYATLRQTLGATVTGPVPASLNWTREYDGVGPSVALEMRKRIKCSRFSGIAKGSGALLYGTKSIERTVVGDQSPQPAVPFLRLSDADEVVGIGEFGFGLEWAATMAHGSELAIAGTYEGQLWAEAGAPTLGFLGFQGFGLHAELRR